MPDPQALPVARELLGLMFPPDSREHIFDAVLHAMIANLAAGARQSEQSDVRANAIVDQYLSDLETDGQSSLRQNMPGLFEAYARAYARHFSAEELQQIKAFAETAAGIKFLQRSNLILSDPDVAQWQADQFSAEIRRMQPRLYKLQADIAALKKSEGVGK